MSVQIIDRLTPSQMEQIQIIINESKKIEYTSISFPMSDADFYVYYEMEGTIIAVAAFLEESMGFYECCAYTMPHYRRIGLFTQLFDEVLEYVPEDTAFIFYLDGKCISGERTLKSMEAELIHVEYMMEYPLSGLSVSESFRSSHPEITMLETVCDNAKTYCYQAPYGNLNITVFSSYYYLYGFEIEKKFRRKGYGEQFLLYVLQDLATKNPMPLRLQVAGRNIPAVSLYKKTGFHFTETLSEYHYY